jgi:hypothetical protein
MFQPLALILSIFLFLASSNTLAFGPTGGMASMGKSNTRSMLRVDEYFLSGKKIVASRNTSIGKIKLCLKADDDAVKLKRKTLKPYIGVTTDHFINSIHECDKPEVPIIERLGDDNTAYVVYYFNKRYKLKLTQHSSSAIAEYSHYEK